MGLWEAIHIILVQDAQNDINAGINDPISLTWLKEYRNWLKENKEFIRKTEPDFVELILDECDTIG